MYKRQVLTQPVVFPGQLCALSLAGVRRESLVDGRVRAVVNLGAAYDHRYLNGADAIRFLRAVKSIVENPEPQW